MASNETPQPQPDATRNHIGAPERTEEAPKIGMGNESSPRRKVCGTGPIKSMGLLPTKARTELVPRINAKAIMGDAMITERPMSRAGERVSPARIATYSNPLNAPIDSLVKIFRQ